VEITANQVNNGAIQEIEENLKTQQIENLKIK
jgi:hypothetical protein